MARQKRINLPGGIYHVITRGLNGALLFKDDVDREEFLRRFAAVLQKTSCRCYGWALMANHIHLLIRTSETSLSEFARKLLTGYAKYFNRRHKRRGYVYQNRYKSVLCQEERYLLELVRYIHLNPARAGIVNTLDELDDYLWTGHAEYMGNKKHALQTVGEILVRFGSRRRQARTGYRGFIEEGWGMGKRPDLVETRIKRISGGWAKDTNSDTSDVTWRGCESILGDDDFVQYALGKAGETMLGKEKMKNAGWDMQRLAREVCERMSITPEDLRRRGRANKISFAKALLAYWGYAVVGLNGAEIARYLSLARPSLNYLIALGERLANEKGLKLIN